MFSSAPNYTKLKTNLRLAITRLKLLEKKKTELTEKSRREIADYIAAGKIERAKIRVEFIIREDYLVEALEIVEMYCDLLLARFGLIQNMKELDDGIAEAVASIIWVAPRIQADVQEIKVIADLLAAKYGQPFADACRIESIESISSKLKHKMSIQSPGKLLVEKYVIEIAKCFNIPYEPDSEIMALERGSDALLVDLSDNKNNLGGGGGIPQPPGFFGYPQPPVLPMPALPNFNDPVPFSYPPSLTDSKAFEAGGNASAPLPSFSYNIPPGPSNGSNGGDCKESNVDNIADNLPTYSMVFPDAKKDTNRDSPKDDNLENSDKPKPQPRSKLNNYEFNITDLPSVPSNLPGPPTNASEKDDDIDFDDLTRRFNELKKKY